MVQQKLVSSEKTNEKENICRDEPELRFPEFKDKWKKEKIGEISKTYSGGTPSTSNKNFYIGNIPFIKSGEINSEETEQYINEDAINNSSAKLVKKGDLLLALYGATSGEVAISKLDGAINQAVLKIDNEMDNVFQYNYFLKEKENIVHKYLQGGQGNLSSKIIKNLELYYPNINEQKKIANFLLTIDKKIGLLEKKLVLYQQLEKDVRKSIFNFNDEKIGFNKFLLGEIAEIKKGFTPSTQNEEFWNDGKYLWLSIADMNKKYLTETSKKITEKAIKNRAIIPKNTLVMSFKLTIGKLAILKEDMFTNEAIASFNWKNKKISTEYMYFYLKSINIKKYGSQAAKGITLNNETLNSIPVYLPDLNKQKEIVEILLSFNNKIEMLKTQLTALNRFKKGLLQKMFV